MGRQTTLNATATKRPSRRQMLISWLDTDEAGSRPFRARRLARLLKHLPPEAGGRMLWGGEDSLQIFNELRLAYIHALYFATVLLVLAYVEKELAGFFHVAGDNKVRRATLEQLCQMALECGWITRKQFAAFNRLRQVRNGYAHFRTWKDRSGRIRRALSQNRDPGDWVEKDANFALKTLGAFIERQPGTEARIRRELQEQESK